MALVAECFGLTEMPSSLPDDLDWLILLENNISIVDTKNITFPLRISKLDFNSNFFEQISNEFLEQFFELTSLDISNNKLRFLPGIISNMTSLEEVWITGNNFECNCDSIWMRDWVVNNTDIIHDSDEAKCHMESGSWIQIKTMNEVDMGCVDHYIPIWVITGKTKSILWN